jgi:nucleoside-diphosphate-sugar epimerase
MWYQYAKTSAEEVATKFLKENNIDYVVMNPAVTIGPLLQPELNGSSYLIFNLINGNLYFVIKHSFFFIELKKLHKIFI